MKTTKKTLSSSLLVSIVTALLISVVLYSCAPKGGNITVQNPFTGFSFTGTVVEKTAAGAGSQFNNGKYTILNNGILVVDNLNLDPSGTFMRTINSLPYRYIITPNDLNARCPVIYDQLGSLPTSQNPPPYGYTFQLPIPSPTQIVDPYLRYNKITISLKDKNTRQTVSKLMSLIKVGVVTPVIPQPAAPTNAISRQGPQITANTQYRIIVEGIEYPITSPSQIGTAYSYEIEIFL